jgi:hypothetical protein
MRKAHRSTARLFRVKQPAKLRPYTKDLKEIADDIHFRDRYRLATTGETAIVRAGEGEIAGNVLVGTAHGAELVIRIG